MLSPASRSIHFRQMNTTKRTPTRSWNFPRVQRNGIAANHIVVVGTIVNSAFQQCYLLQL